MSATEQFVDVTYRGLEVGRRLKLSEVAPTTAHLELSTPLPVGAKLVIATDEGPELEVRVLRVYEQVAGAEKPPGMRVQPEGLAGEAERWWSERVSAEDPGLSEANAPESDRARAAEAGDGQSTEPMSPADLKALAAETEGEQGGGNGEPPGRSTVKMSSEQIKTITDTAKDSGEDGGGKEHGTNGRDGKRKRKRRPRKKKKS